MAVQLVDFQVSVRASTIQQVGITPIQIVTFPQVPANYTWRVEGITVIAFVSLGPQPVRVFDRPLGPNVVPIDLTELSPFWPLHTEGEQPTSGPPAFWWDVDDRSSPLTIPAAGQLSFVFDGVNAAPGTCQARIQYALYEGSTQTQPTEVAGMQRGPLVPVSI